MKTILPLPLLQHLAANGAGQAERRVEVDAEHGIPVLVGMLGGRGAADDAGVVEQNVDDRKVGLHLLDEALQLLQLAKVGLVAPVLAAQGLHRCFGFAAGGHVHGYADDVGASLGQPEGNGLSNTPVAARYQGALAG